MRTESTTNRKRAWWSLVWDEATDTLRAYVVLEASQEEAEDAGIAAANLENHYLPEEDGGFRIIGAFHQDELRGILDEMERAEKSACQSNGHSTEPV